jgi:hypothetical protein
MSKMRNLLTLEEFSTRSESEKIEMINIALCISAIIAAFFSGPLAWGFLLLPLAYLLLAGVSIRSAKPGRIPGLSDDANLVLQKWRFHYLRPDLCVVSRALRLAAVIVAILGCFYGFYLGLVFGIAVCLLTFGLVPAFDPNRSMHDPMDCRSHEEVIAFISQRLENESAQVPAMPAFVPGFGHAAHPLQPLTAHSRV